MEGDTWELKGKFGEPPRPPKKEEKREEAKPPKKITKEDKETLKEEETAAHFREPKAGMVALISLTSNPEKRLAVQGGKLVLAEGDEYDLENYWFVEKISADNKYAGDSGVGGQGWHISSVASYNKGEKLHKGRLAINDADGVL